MIHLFIWFNLYLEVFKITKETFINCFDRVYELLSAYIYDKYMQSDQYMRGLCLNTDIRSFIIDDLPEEYALIGVTKIQIRVSEAHPYIKYRNIMLANYNISCKAFQNNSTYEYDANMYSVLNTFDSCSKGFELFKLHNLQSKYDMDIIINYEFNDE